MVFLFISLVGWLVGLELGGSDDTLRLRLGRILSESRLGRKQWEGVWDRDGVLNIGRKNILSSSNHCWRIDRNGSKEQKIWRRFEGKPCSD